MPVIKISEDLLRKLRVTKNKTRMTYNQIIEQWAKESEERKKEAVTSWVIDEMTKINNSIEQLKKEIDEVKSSVSIVNSRLSDLESKASGY